MVAALLNLNKSAVSSFKTGDEKMVIGVIVKNVTNDCFFRQGLADVFFYLNLFFIAKHQINFFHGRKFGCGYLCRAAGDDYAGIRVLAAKLANGLPTLALCFLGDSAGIDNDEIVYFREFFFQNL